MIGMLVINVVKIMKLGNCGIHAIRVTSKDADLVDDVERGSYQFGEYCQYM